jgi:hypothetical protein
VRRSRKLAASDLLLKAAAAKHAVGPLPHICHVCGHHADLPGLMSTITGQRPLATLTSPTNTQPYHIYIYIYIYCTNRLGHTASVLALLSALTIIMQRLPIRNRAPSAGQPTDQLVKVRGIKTTKKLKAGGCCGCGRAQSAARCAALQPHRNSPRRAAGKTIARIPKVGGLFSPEQLPQSAAWPALKFMQDQVRAAPCPAETTASCLQRAELNMIYTCVQRPGSRRFFFFLIFAIFPRCAQHE